MSMPPDADAMNTGLSRLAIDDDAEVKLLPDIEAFFDENLLNLAPFRAGLRRHQVHAEHLPGDLLGFFRALRQLHASALAASAGMNLRLDDDRPAEPLRNFPRFFLRIRNFSARYPHAVARKNLLRLVLMYFHQSSTKTLNFTKKGDLHREIFLVDALDLDEVRLPATRRGAPPVMMTCWPDSI